MDKFERIPRVGDLRFIPANDQQPRVYNTFPFDRGLLQQQVLSFQYGDYQQKRNETDLITIYIDSLAPNIKLHIYDDSGNLLLTGDYGGEYEAYLPGNTAPNGDIYYTYRKLLRPDTTTPMPPGMDQRIYYYVIECVYGSEIDNRFYVSEPIYVRKAYDVATPTGMRQCGGWEDTVMVECTNSENAEDVLFETIWNTIIRQRVEGFVLPGEMIMNDTAFIDQQYRSRTLQSVPGNTFRFTADGIPDYLRDKLNRMLSLSSIRIDGTRYTKRDGAKWETEKEQSSMISTTSIVLEEYEDGNTYAGSSATVLFTLAVDESEEIIFPFAWNYLALYDTFTTITVDTAKVFEDEATLSARLATLNSTVISAAGLTGALALVGNTIVYNNGTGEAFGAPLAADNMFVMHKYIYHQIRLGVTPGAGQFRFFTSSTAGGTAHIVTDWGDGAIEWGLIFDVALTTISHEYTQSTPPVQRALRIFHRGDTYDFDSPVTRFAFSNPIGQPTVLYVVSSTNVEAPVGLEQYTIAGHPLVGVSNIDFSFLAPAKDSLILFICQQCSVGPTSMFVPSLFDYGVTFSVLRLFSVSANQLTGAQVDDTIISLYDNTVLSVSPPKILQFWLQAPPAPPSDPTALTYIGNWLAMGYTVNTD